MTRTPEKRNDHDLIELALELHARAIAYPSKEMHDAAIAARSELERRLTIKKELYEALKALAEQFDEYADNDWLGKGVWRTRIGLPGDRERALAALAKVGG